MHYSGLALKVSINSYYVTNKIIGTIIVTSFSFSVLALFPDTTCFYKAKVDVPPATSTDEYRVYFEDMSYQSGYSPSIITVAQRYVIAENKDEDA